MESRTYLAIDLKSFYASVECRLRRLDPMTTNLVVADKTRTEKNICLAVSPSMKAYGIPGRPRLFEVVQRMELVNQDRLQHTPGGSFTGSSWDAPSLQQDPGLKADYLIAPPRMALYMEYSARIYQIYLRYVAPEDLFAYSIDEVFMDITSYLKTYGLSARVLAMRILQDVLNTTGITATAGIGPNLYLCKVALDIESKHIPPDENGVRIAELDEAGYRRRLWTHRPLTDFWRVGPGYARKLEAHGLYTMGDIARCSLGKPGSFHSEDLLYRLFGVNAELLIDHAWGWEPCTMAEIKAYRPASSSIGSGQVLQHPYSWEKARLVLREMADLLVLDLVDKGLVTAQLTLTVGYDVENLNDPRRRERYHGPVKTDAYGRSVPRHAHGTIHLESPTSSTRLFLQAATALYDRIVCRDLLVRRITLTACDVREERTLSQSYQQMDLFAQDLDPQEKEALDREKKMQQTVLEIKKKYGKNAILKGMNLQEDATARDRNSQIGGHRA